jgi:cytidylate kinase
MMNHVAPIETITLSRQFGAASRACAQELARLLGWKLLDEEAVPGISAVPAISEQDLGPLDDKGKRPTLWKRLHRHGTHRAYLAALKEWMDLIADDGKAVVLGRGAPILMRYRAGTFHARLVAPAAERARHVRELEPELDENAALEKCRKMDEESGRFVQYFFGEDDSDLLNYHAILNTGPLVPTAVANLLAAVADRTAGGPNHSAVAPPADTPGLPRVLTLTSQLGSRETDLARELGRRLNLQVWDRETLARETGLATVSDVDLAAIDQAGVEALQRVMGELARRGDVLIVGRGGSEFLRDCPSALRVKLITPISERVRRVMEYRWIEDAAARAAIAESDARRAAFYQQNFGVNWESPLEFDMVLNTAALGPRTADLIVQAASLKWYGAAPGTRQIPPLK